ncbi:peroxiredoxin [Clostridium gasigenes]|uniref:thioredoxin-dependent peroxiredoxin n=1 Tax=Clostridium gasigenes TaxID=94869 RepID=A0A1H0QST4_9CLOT|nr:peroxiredoxin [Clostridium gasigenes]MBB6625113.1 peroxiredoxin [Clostridium gasigenes]MBB6716586.1 peroxiredoxin [Clostridium gasigenes]MBU3089078.1 peroxiredoxin [Clostridium gasigenes]MBU3133823.1 peroxiredoxin [Clostridium gasigenes]NKF06777.1 peroxiredoxin [Clostridium gasigenes]
MIEVGNSVPNFSLIGSDNNLHSLSDYKGKKVILYFYPRDNTPGCTTEACEFRDNNKQIIDSNTIILGISKDTLASHVKFITKFDLPFILLSDEEKTVCNLFDVIKEKNMYGKKVLGIERSTFLIDENGILIKEYRKVKVKGHVDSIIEEFFN